MTQELIVELNLALIPEQRLADRHIALSQQLAGRYPAVIRLNGVTPRLAFTPHLTLYQVPIKVQDMAALYAALAQLTANASALPLTATEFASNQQEGSFEVRYDAASELMVLQDDLLAAVNPLRGNLLLERDPAGHKLTDLITELGIAGDNLRRTGFDAVGDPAQGGLFHPHVTINWFELGTSVALNAPDWPPISDFNGRFVALGIHLLGPYGTCAQRLAALQITPDRYGAGRPAISPRATRPAGRPRAERTRRRSHPPRGRSPTPHQGHQRQQRPLPGPDRPHPQYQLGHPTSSQVHHQPSLGPASAATRCRTSLQLGKLK